MGIVSVHIRDTGWAEILDLRVHAGTRREGIGRMLLESCESYALSNGAVGICAVTADSNAVMCQFLENEGFVVGGIDRMALLYSPAERLKPASLRACELMFYRRNTR